MVLSMERWKGKVAVVTGASSGIGAGVAKKLLENGIIVVGMARRKELIEQISTSTDLYSLKVDVTNEDETIEAFKWVTNNLGPISILVNSASTFWLTSSIYGETQMWKDVFDTDIFGLLVATKYVVQQMILNNIDGHIIHINGVTGHNAHYPSSDATSTCKYAVRAMTEHLRRELVTMKSKIRVSVKEIAPGAVDTKLLFGNASEQPELLEHVKEFAKVLKLDTSEVADSVIYALSTPPHVQVHSIVIRGVGTPY